MTIKELIFPSTILETNVVMVIDFISKNSVRLGVGKKTVKDRIGDVEKLEGLVTRMMWTYPSL